MCVIFLFDCQRWMLIDWWRLFEVIDSLLTAEANWIELVSPLLIDCLICLFVKNSFFVFHLLIESSLLIFVPMILILLKVWTIVRLNANWFDFDFCWVLIALWLTEESLWSERWMSGNVRMAWPEAPHNKRLLCMLVVCGACACGEYESLIVLEVICTACVEKVCFGHFWLSLIVFWLWYPLLSVMVFLWLRTEIVPTVRQMWRLCGCCGVEPSTEWWSGGECDYCVTQCWSRPCIACAAACLFTCNGRWWRGDEL